MLRSTLAAALPRIPQEARDPMHTHRTVTGSPGIVGSAVRRATIFSCAVILLSCIFILSSCPFILLSFPFIFLSCSVILFSCTVILVSCSVIFLSWIADVSSNFAKSFNSSFSIAASALLSCSSSFSSCSAAFLSQLFPVQEYLQLIPKDAFMPSPAFAQ